tara:strand:- start:2114 stop:3553 length:1440 start_codon:yes stop_codon:yes gene_type:complete
MNYEEIQKLFLERGFFFPSSEIYSDAPAGFWDYGPLGVNFRNKFIEFWRKHLIRRDGMLEIDGSQILSRNVFVASGHLDNFSDPITNCTKCKSIYRADRLISELSDEMISEKLSNDIYDKKIVSQNIRCPSCNSKLSNVSRFNMMYNLGIGPKSDQAYLRPETCQNIFVDYLRLFKTMRIKLPIGFAQFGKSFRNEISPRQSLLRLREFYQAEIEVFFNPENVLTFDKFSEVSDCKLNIFDKNSNTVSKSCREFVDTEVLPNEFIAYYLALVQQFYNNTGIDSSKTRFRILPDDDRAFYASHSFDFEVLTSLGWLELVACNDRSNYDLTRHSQISGKDLSILDNDSKIIPNVFEISMGVDRSLYSIIEHCYSINDDRNLLSFKPGFSPIDVAIFPLVNKNDLPSLALDIYNRLKLDFHAYYDSAGSIGRRYRRQDEIGTPICITVDYDSITNNDVTFRYRDSMEQIRVPVDDIKLKLLQ